MKLPALYLVDSICKNVGGLYIVEFEPLISERLPQLFSSLMDDQIRKDILRTLDTWDSIFSSHTVQKLHKFIGNSPSIEKIQENKRALPAADPRAMRFTGKLDFSDNATGGPRKRPNFEPVPRNFDPRIYNQNPSVSAIKSNVFTPNFHNNQRLPPTQQIPQASTIPRILSKPITEMLTDLRAMMTVTPHLYRPQEVGGLMMALQRECHACGEDAFFHTVDSRARLPDKRPLVELIDAQLSADHLIRKTSFEHVYPIRPVSQSYNYLDLNMTAPLESHLDKPIELASTNVQNSISTPQYSIPDTLFTNGLPFDVAPLLASLSANLPFGLNINPSSIPPIPRPIAPKEPPIRPVYEDIIM